MRLKSLKLAGFKSFANPTTFSFKHDITAIVGPNGCGKSNVIDAIRWVLGETSAKQLRGGAMSDVIFAGTDGKSAKSLASVELTFEHTQDEKLGIRHALNLYHELTLRRQVTKDGKSDYFINNQRVRRRDVIDVFLGTGLGSRSYAVIEQGMIGRIIDADGTKLREFIEEAAGVSRYQVRREETTKQLNEAIDNLTRLNDLQSELKKQQKILIRQAESAKRYEVIQSQLHDIQTELLVHQLFAIYTQKTEQQKSLEIAKQALAHADDTLAQKRVEFDQVSSRLGEMTYLRDNLKDDYHQHEIKRNTALHELNDLKQKIQDHELSDEKLLENTQKLTTQVQTLTQNIATLSEGLSGIYPEYEELSSNHEHDKQKLAEYEEMWRVAKSELSAAFNKKNELDNAKNIHDVKQKRWAQEQQRWQQKHEALTKNFVVIDTADLQNRINAHKERLAQCDRQLEFLEGQLTQKQPEFEHLQSLVQSTAHELTAKEKEHASLSAQYHTLHGLVYPPIKPAISSDGDFGVWQTCSSLQSKITLTEQGRAFADVLDIYLQSMLDSKVVFDDVAKITHHQSEVAARAGIVGLWQDGAVWKRYPLPDGFIWLDELIKSPTLTLWHNVCLMTGDDITQADDLLNTNPNLKIVTKTGWLVQQGGVINLAQGEQHGFLVQREENLAKLAHLEEILDTLESEIDTKQKQHKTKQSTLQTLQVELQELQEKIATLVRERQATEKILTQDLASLDGANFKLTSHAERLAELEREKSELDKEQEALLQQAKTLHDEYHAHDMVLDHAKRHTHRTHEDYLNLENAFKQKDKRYQELAMQIRLDEERLAHAKSRLIDIEHELEQQQAIYAQKHNENAILQQDLPKKQQVFDEMNAHCHALKVSLDEQEHNLKNMQSELLKLQHALTAAHTDIATHQANASALQANIDATIMRLNELGESLRSHADVNVASLLHDFESPNYTLAKPRHELNAAQANLQAELGKLGAVNLAAAAELDEITARIEPMDKQILDIEESIKALDTAIETIDEKTKSLFLQALSAVNEELNTLFVKVFGGGQASLTLMEDESLSKANKWRAGLVLMAQPKGKKNSRLAVLSGGEKTLTALSLIFAIFKQNPAPFCVLDEVDAPLDDANVGRFTGLIDELAKDVQFIFISHNKLAMQMAHELKGITMPTAGISSLVTVSLQEAQEYIQNA